MRQLYHNLLDAFIDERYQEKRRTIKACLHKPDTLKDKERWGTELSNLECWRLASKLSPTVISLIAVIISIVALLK